MSEHTEPFITDPIPPSSSSPPPPSSPPPQPSQSPLRSTYAPKIDIPPPGTSSSSLVGEDSIELPTPQGKFIYKLGPVNFAIEAEFEQRCERNEIQAIERRINDVSPLTYSHLIEAYCNRLGARKWAWNGLPSIEARMTVDGLIDLYFFVLRYHNDPRKTGPRVDGAPIITEGLVREIFEKDEPKWRELDAKIKRLTDPNPTVPTPPVGY